MVSLNPTTHFLIYFLFKLYFVIDKLKAAAAQASVHGTETVVYSFTWLLWLPLQGNVLT